MNSLNEMERDTQDGAVHEGSLTDLQYGLICQDTKLVYVLQVILESGRQT